MDKKEFIEKYANLCNRHVTKEELEKDIAALTKTSDDYWFKQFNARHPEEVRNIIAVTAKPFVDESEKYITDPRNYVSRRLL